MTSFYCMALPQVGQKRIPGLSFVPQEEQKFGVAAGAG